MKSFSAKDLISRSCMQIRLFDLCPEKRPTPNFNIVLGEEFQHNVAKQSDKLIGEEMRGTYITDGICINFTNDIVCEDKIIEVKSVNREYEDWYLKNSILQCALYSSLLKMSNHRLVTATFYVNKGNECIETYVSPNINYELRFGDVSYKIEVTDADSIVNFIVDKARNCMSWDSARCFDNIYKHREFEVLKKFFNYKKEE